MQQWQTQDQPVVAVEDLDVGVAAEGAGGVVGGVVGESQKTKR